MAAISSAVNARGPASLSSGSRGRLFLFAGLSCSASHSASFSRAKRKDGPATQRTGLLGPRRTSPPRRSSGASTRILSSTNWCSIIAGVTMNIIVAFLFFPSWVSPGGERGQHDHRQGEVRDTGRGIQPGDEIVSVAAQRRIHLGRGTGWGSHSSRGDGRGGGAGTVSRYSYRRTAEAETNTFLGVQPDVAHQDLGSAALRGPDDREHGQAHPRGHRVIFTGPIARVGGARGHNELSSEAFPGGIYLTLLALMHMIWPSSTCCPSCPSTGDTCSSHHRAR